jgi:outer membrane protein assembly factor BamB
MKKTLGVATVLLIGWAAAQGQTPYKIHTCPKLPARDALERMNLTLAWKTRVTVDGNRDGIASLQLIPGTPSQVIVQTFKGAVFLFDADHGDLIWKTTVGVPYWTPQPAGFNAHSIYVTRRSMLHVLSRRDGAQRVYTYDPISKQYAYGYDLRFTPNAAPIADEDYLYVPMGDRVHAILVPDIEVLDKIKAATEARKKAGKADPMPEEEVPETLDSPQPDFFWGYKLAGELMTSSPLINGDRLAMLTTDGTLTSVSRYERGPRIEEFEFKANGKTPGAAGQHLHVAFVASEDFNVYAINLKSVQEAQIIWRHVSGAPIRQQPYVNDRDVYIAPERIGLRRLDRETGREVWTNRDTNRFLAANLNNVYALDHIGRFYVLDARRGTTLAKLDLSEWPINFPNEWTDRIYLAANDGQVICLRHRELAKALKLKTLDVPPPPKIEEKKKPPMEEKKKDDEKKDDKDKDKDKDKEKAAVEWLRLPRQVALDAMPHRPDGVWDARRTWAGR